MAHVQAAVPAAPVPAAVPAAVQAEMHTHTAGDDALAPFVVSQEREW